MSKKDVKKFDDMSENNNSSSGEELSDDELFNVAGGQDRVFDANWRREIHSTKGGPQAFWDRVERECP